MMPGFFCGSFVASRENDASVESSLQVFSILFLLVPIFRISVFLGSPELGGRGHGLIRRERTLDTFTTASEKRFSSFDGRIAMTLAADIGSVFGPGWA